MNKVEVLVIHHKDCADGTLAKWAVWDFYRRNQFKHDTHPANITFIEADYGDEIPNLDGKVVWIVDFSYDPEKLIKASGGAIEVTLLDHHKTMKDNWIKYFEKVQKQIGEGLTPLSKRLTQHLPGQGSYLSYWMYGNLKAHHIHDMSGAVMTWRYLNAAHSVFDKNDGTGPMLLQYSQDHDLGKWKIQGSREIIAAFYDRMKGTSIELIDEMVSVEAWLVQLASEGSTILRHQKNLAQDIIDKSMRKMVVMGHRDIPVCYAPRALRTLIGGMLAEKAPFSLTFEDNYAKNVRDYSFRSNRKVEGWVDVEELAKQAEGGGHECAAGVARGFNRVSLFEEQKENKPLRIFTVTQNTYSIPGEVSTIVVAAYTAEEAAEYTPINAPRYNNGKLKFWPPKEDLIVELEVTAGQYVKSGIIREVRI